MAAKSFKDLIVWQKSFVLAKGIYRLCEGLPDSERFGLCSQMQRSAVSIVYNIAEGYERNNRGEYYHFLGVARGSSAELEAQLLLAESLYGLNVQQEADLLTEVQKLLCVISQKLNPHP